MLRRRTFPIQLGLMCGALLLVGCSGGSDTRDEELIDNVPKGRHLLTLDSPVKAHMDAIAAGSLGINDAGCFTLNRRVLIGPPGSTIDDDGQGVTLSGVGHYSIGDSVRGGGGYIERPLSEVPEHRVCFPNSAFSKVVVLSQPLND
jgi:hypothetical protein